MRVTPSLMVLLFAAGCASTPPPHPEVASATAAVRGAEEAGAQQFPQSALHVKLAEEQVNRARELMEREENDRARAVAVRAYQDAELALALAREAQSERQLHAFLEAHPRLRSEEASQGGESPHGDASPPSEQPSAP